MAAIEVSKPNPFQIPQYDFEAVKKIAASTNLNAFYEHLLQDTLETSENDFTYGLPPRTAQRLHDRLINGFAWQEWVTKMESMGTHYTVCTTTSLAS